MPALNSLIDKGWKDASVLLVLQRGDPGGRKDRAFTSCRLTCNGNNGQRADNEESSPEYNRCFGFAGRLGAGNRRSGLVRSRGRTFLVFQSHGSGCHGSFFGTDRHWTLLSDADRGDFAGVGTRVFGVGPGGGGFHTVALAASCGARAIRDVLVLAIASALAPQNRIEVIATACGTGARGCSRFQAQINRSSRPRCSGLARSQERALNQRSWINSNPNATRVAWQRFIAGIAQGKRSGVENIHVHRNRRRSEGRVQHALLPNVI